MDRGKGRERKKVEIRLKKRINYLRECGPLHTHTPVKLQIKLEIAWFFNLKQIMLSDLTKILLQCDIVWLKSDYKIQTRFLFYSNNFFFLKGFVSGVIAKKKYIQFVNAYAPT